ncbi:MAG TPA: DUF1810 family protein [Vicinamibacterales bacterium]|nr:DUF1810 family protein [Vicinamibacterales bacterium]
MSLDRFREAQNSAFAGFDTALDELRSGGKRSHWIWYVFPQLDGLGSSTYARTFALNGVAEAEEYLRDPELRRRLLGVTTVVAEQLRKGTAVDVLMGSDIDAKKLVSSLTLFRHVARSLPGRKGSDEYAALARAADDVLAVAAAQGYPPCAYTLGRLRSSP